jgi:NADPH-dependent 2,4-dienoyl-CoA reductase/sulfur reductase-like enzyme
MMNTKNTTISRRHFMKWTSVGMATLWGLGQSKLVLAATPYHVVVVGGGFAGATAAKYLKLWGGGSVNVTLVEPNSTYYSPILSNLVLNNNLTADKLAFSYATLTSKYQVTHKANKVTTIDAANKTVTLDDSSTLTYDRLIVAPGIEFDYVNNYDTALVPHAWQGGAQVDTLHSQLAAMQDGGTFVITIPPSPFRCPPGPYERACIVADWLQRNKPASKVVVLDANADIVVEKDSFSARFTQYGVTYLAGVTVTNVNSDTKTVTVSGAPQTSYAADILNVIPPQKAGANALLSSAGLLSGNWAPVEPKTFESTLVANIHIIGDAQGTGVPKAGHIGNSEAKVAAEAVLNLLHGLTTATAPKLNSACYSPVSLNEATWLTGTFEYKDGQMVLVSQSFASGAPSTRNYSEMFGWASNLLSDTFA